jgi:hypothetical protein
VYSWEKLLSRAIERHPRIRKIQMRVTRFGIRVKGFGSRIPNFKFRISSFIFQFPVLMTFVKLIILSAFMPSMLIPYREFDFIGFRGVLQYWITFGEFCVADGIMLTIISAKLEISYDSKFRKEAAKFRKGLLVRLLEENGFLNRS